MGGKHGLSIVMYSKLSIAELKKHLADHIAISDEAMQKTEFCWKVSSGPMKSALINLCDQKSVKSIAEYVSEVGVLDVYAKIPAELNIGADSEEV
jgi:hypothetical protein